MSDWSWRLPLIFQVRNTPLSANATANIFFQAFPSVIVVISVFFLPESPRWMVANDRDDEAMAFLVKYHGGGDPNSAIVKLQW